MKVLLVNLLAIVLIIASFYSRSIGQVMIGKSSIIVDAPAMSKLDTLEIRIWDDILGYEHLNDHRIYRAVNENGKYYFEFDTIRPFSRVTMYLSFQRKNGRPFEPILDKYLHSPDDSLVIHLSPSRGMMIPSGGYDTGEPVMRGHWACDFRGRGAKKYQLRYCQDMSDHHDRLKRIQEESVDLRALNKFEEAMNHQIFRMGEDLTRLMDTKELLSQQEYYTLKADMEGSHLLAMATGLKRFLETKRLSAQDSLVGIQFFEQKLRFDANRIDTSFLLHAARSDVYIRYLMIALDLELLILDQGKLSLHEKYDWLRERITRTDLKNRVLTHLLYQYASQGLDPILLKNAKNDIQDNFCLSWIERFENGAMGNKMSSFLLPDLEGRYHNIPLDYNGKVVLLDFWYVGCTPCKHYMENVVKPVEELFSDIKDVVFLTISADHQETLTRAKKHNLLSDATINLYTDGQRFDHPIIQYFGIRSYPSPILLNRKGELLSRGIDLRTKESLINAINAALD